MNQAYHYRYQSTHAMAIYNMNDLREVLVVQTSNLMKSRKFVQDYTHTDLLLLMGYLGSVPIIAASIYAFTLPNFGAGVPSLVISVIIYYLCSALAFLYQRYTRKNTIWTGKRNDTQVLIGLKCDKYSDIIKWSLKKGALVVEKQASIGTYFDSDGEFIPSQLESLFSVLKID